MRLKTGPREKLEKYGISSLTNEELLAVIIKTGTKTKNVLEISNNILKDIMNIKLLNDYSFNELMKYDGIGKAKAMTIVCALELSRRVEMMNPNIKKIITPYDIYMFSKDYFINLSNERVLVIFMNQKMRIIHSYIHQEGVFDRVLINDREILKKAIKLNSSVIALVHNHPNGVEMASEEDYEVMINLENKLKEFDITLFDSLVITEKTYYSMKYGNIPKKIE